MTSSKDRAASRGQRLDAQPGHAEPGHAEPGHAEPGYDEQAWRLLGGEMGLAGLGLPEDLGGPAAAWPS